METKQQLSEQLTVGELIEKLQQYDRSLPICGFSESMSEFVNLYSIDVESDSKETVVYINFD